MAKADLGPNTRLSANPERDGSESAVVSVPLSSMNIPEWLEKNEHLLQPPVNNFCVYDSGFTVMVVGGPNRRNDFHINPTAEWFYQYEGDMILRLGLPKSGPIDFTLSDPDSTAPATATATVAATTPDGAETAEFRFVDVPIREKSMYLLPGGVPHSPIRFANTVGVVVEQTRPAGLDDALVWFCEANATEGDGEEEEDRSPQRHGADEQRKKGDVEKEPGEGGCGRIAWKEQFHLSDLGSQVKEAIERARNVPNKTCPSCGHEWTVK